MCTLHLSAAVLNKNVAFSVADIKRLPASAFFLSLRTGKRADNDSRGVMNSLFEIQLLCFTITKGLLTGIIDTVLY